MGTYTDLPSESTVRLVDRHIYGSSRLGVVEETGTGTNMSGASVSATSFVHTTGKRTYELSNHLGNVLVTVSDMRTPNVSGSITYFKPQVRSISDYSSFGAYLAGTDRKTTETTYDYGFNGKRKDAEMYSVSGSSYDFDARLYNSRLGRWMSGDPLFLKYPSFSPYNFAINCPMYYMDNDGKEIVITGENGIKFVYGRDKTIPDDKFIQRTVNSLRAISMHAESKKIIDELASTNDFHLEISQTVSTETRFEPKIWTIPSSDNPDPQGRMPQKEGTIQYDVHTGIKAISNVGDGESFGPFIALFHEIGHSYRYWKSFIGADEKSAMQSAISAWDEGHKSDPTWYNNEEKANCTEFELPICKFFGVLNRLAYFKGYAKKTDFESCTDIGNGIDVMEDLEMIKPKQWQNKKKDIVAPLVPIPSSKKKK